MNRIYRYVRNVGLLYNAPGHFYLTQKTAVSVSYDCEGSTLFPLSGSQLLSIQLGAKTCDEQCKIYKPFPLLALSDQKGKAQKSICTAPGGTDQDAEEHCRRKTRIRLPYLSFDLILTLVVKAQCVIGVSKWRWMEEAGQPSELGCHVSASRKWSPNR